MDALALLCTLHADGPATLKRLRSAGCTTLASVIDVDADRLAEILGTTDAGAQRFVREAKVLQMRVGPLGREEPLSAVRGSTHDAGEHADEDEHARRGSGAAVGANARSKVSDAGTPVGVDSSQRLDANAGEDAASIEVETARASLCAAERLAARERDVFERVLDAWRERDREDGLADATSDSTDAPIGTADRDPVAGAAREPISSAARCRPGAIDGLDEALCIVLANAGVDDLTGLAAIDAVEMSRLTGLGFSKLARLRFLAERQLQGDPRQRVFVRTARPIELRAPPIAGPTHKFSASDRPSDFSHEAIDMESDLLATPRAPLPGRDPNRFEASSSESCERAAGPFA